MKQKRITAFIITVVMMFMLLPGNIAFAESIFAGGSGTEDDPYKIATLAQLEAFRDNVNSGNDYDGKYIMLTADIDLLGSDTNRWTPIGTPLSGHIGTKFKGTFEGNGKTIKNIYAQDNSNQGLFRYIDRGGTIQNLKIAGYVKGYAGYSGAIAASNDGTIKNCTSSCTVETNQSGSCVGGITGSCHGIVENCVFDGIVTGGCEIGGIAGYASSSAEIRNCLNKGSVTGTSTSSSEGVGGIAGHSQSKYIENCCSVGTITSSMANTGGIVGDATQTITNSYYLAGCAGEETTLNTTGTAKTADDFSGGAVTWLLNGGNPNGVWKQTLGEDNYPGFSGGNVYSGYESCEATERSYTNDDAAAEAFHETEGHKGGTATCTARAVCDYCNEEYGEVNASNHIGTKQSIACTDDSKYNKHQWIWSCCSHVEKEEDHNWNYSADDTADTITRTCGYCGKDGTVTLRVDGKTYDKTALSASCEKTGIFAGGRCDNEIKISYCCEGGCKKAGKHTVTLTVGESSVSKEITIEKKEVTLIVSGGYKEYDGTNTVEVSRTSVQGVIPGDSAYVDEELIRVYIDGTTEGQYTTGHAENVKLIDADAENYFFADENGRVAVTLNSEYGDGYFTIYKATINVKPLDQQLSLNADLDQSKYTVDGLDERFTISGVVLYEENGYIYVNTDDIKVFLDGNEVTANFQFSSYSFANIIRMCEGHTFNEEGFCSTGACRTYQEAVKNGDYYEIGNAGQLYWFAEQVNDYNKYDINGKLTADIKVNDNPLADNARKWIPISSGAYSNYSGNFDGNGHTVSGLYCKAENSNVGFFGNLGYNSVNDLHIANSYFEGSNAGGIAGYSSSESITKCSVADDVTVKGTNAGGLVGNTSYDTIENCFSLAAVSGNVWGGLVGYNCDTIKNCYTSLMRPVGYNYKSYGGSMANVYYAEDTNDYTTPDENGYTPIKPTFEGATEVKDFADGEVAYLLQSKVIGELLEYDDDGNPVYGEAPQIWGQKIDTDKYPTFSDAKVYEDEYNSIMAYRNAIDGFEIILLGADKKSATVVLGEPGTYTILLADYEDNRLANVETFEVTVDKAQAVRVTSTKDFTLSTGDKIMLWDNLENLIPMCEAYEVK